MRRKKKEKRYKYNVLGMHFSVFFIHILNILFNIYLIFFILIYLFCRKFCRNIEGIYADGFDHRTNTHLIRWVWCVSI
jgi:hypothetical protein